MNSRQKEVAILLPCYNEAAAISEVVASFKLACPDATIYVYDNNSTDGTPEVARDAGAVVRHVPKQGKGNVVQHMFMEIEADIYVMADGDGTYDAETAPLMIETLIQESADMVVGVRKHESDSAYRHGHQFGNKMLNKMVEWSFGEKVGDMLSGYRIFSRRFVKSFPLLSKGFEIETEITVHALSLQLRVVNVETKYHDRAEGTASKLHTYKDGFRILSAIALLVKYEHPFYFFSIISFILVLLSLFVGGGVVLEFLNTQYITKIPSAILATGLMLSALICFSLGVVLDSVSRGQKQFKKLTYLSTK
ncbi:MAG: glycosyltransferase [Neptuniibacter sp.]